MALHRLEVVKGLQLCFVGCHKCDKPIDLADKDVDFINTNDAVMLQCKSCKEIDVYFDNEKEAKQ